MFTFFLQVYRSSICTFCGSAVKVEFDPNEDDGKFCFRKIENGEYQLGKIPITRHPNILNAVLTGKKSWGLWVNEWSDGIVEWSFTEEEILKEFSDRNIKIPQPLLLDFQNRIDKKIKIRNQRYFEERKNAGVV